MDEQRLDCCIQFGDINNNNDTDTGRLCRFGYEQVY